MKPTIALFLHQPRCSIQSGNGVIKALQSDYNFKIFTKHELENDFFNNVDMLVFPGGIGDAESYRWLFKENGDRVRDFVDRGGRYLGICMGAYWAGSNYFDLLKGVEAVQYITRPGTDTRRPHAKAIPINWQGQDMRMYFYDGCALVGNGGYRTMATYANGDAMAIIQNRIGLIGCHPESSESWYNQYNYLKPHWHQGTHHKLLLNFVNLLMKQ